MTRQETSDVAKQKLELQAKIEEVEETLRKLREQLRVEEESAQHAAIEHLEDYLGEIDNKYTNLRDFWQVIREEWRGLVGKHKDGDGGR